MLDFGERLKYIRKRKHITQDELGAKVGLQKSAVSKYERGKIDNISNEIITRFARALGVSEAELVGSIEETLVLYDLRLVEKDNGVVIKDEIQGLSVFYPQAIWDNIVKENNFHKVWGDLAALTISEKEEELNSFLDALRTRDEVRDVFRVIKELNKEQIEILMKFIPVIKEL